MKNVTHIALQGRPHSNEYVTEYTISYGTTDLEFADYKEPGGNTKVRGEATHPTHNSNAIYDYVCVYVWMYGGSGGDGGGLTKLSPFKSWG